MKRISGLTVDLLQALPHDNIPHINCEKIKHNLLKELNMINL